MSKSIKNVNLRRKNIGIFSLFVLFTTIIWFFNALNQEYQTSLRVTVKYKNMPHNKANVSDLPKNILVTVKAVGYDIMKYKLKNNFIKTKLDIGAEHFMQLNKKDTNNYYILLNEFIEQVDMQLPDNMRVEYLEPDTLYFSFTTFATRKVPIKLNGNISTKPQYIIKDDIIINPDSVTISGPFNVIDSISYVETKYFELHDLTRNITFQTELLPIEHINFSPNNVTLKLAIEEFTETKFNIEISKENVPDSIFLHLFPSSVTVICKVGYSDYKSLKASDFSAYVDYFSIFEGDDGKLNIKLNSNSEKVYDYSFSPNYVEYIVENK